MRSQQRQINSDLATVKPIPQKHHKLPKLDNIFKDNMESLNDVTLEIGSQEYL